MRWEFEARHEDIEALIVTPDAPALGSSDALQPVLTVRLDERIVPELMLGAPSLPLAIARDEVSMIGRRSAALALIRAWPTIAARYRDQMYEERETPTYEAYLRSVDGAALQRVSNLPEMLEASRPDQMLIVAAVLTSLPPEQRALQWAHIHHGFELGTIGMENITRLVTSLSDLIAGDTRHDQDRAEYNPTPISPGDDVSAEIAAMTLEPNPTGGVIPDQLRDTEALNPIGGKL